MSEDLAKVKERIAKLLAMAKDASSPNEAAIAAGRARAMMDKYQLEEFDISHKMVDEFATGNGMDNYADVIPSYYSTLAVAVAGYNDCAARYEAGYFTKSGRDTIGKKIIFLGYKTDVDLAIEMFKRLDDAILRLFREYLNETGQRHSSRVARNFKLGAVGIIIQRIKSMIEERQMITNEAAGTSLVVIKKAAVDEHFGVTRYRTGRGVGPKNWSDHEVRQAGRAAGAKVEITPQVRG